jgi:hypothetical protein
VSGSHPTNLGDVLLLSLEVDHDVRFRLYENPIDIRFSNGYQNIFWFPSSYKEAQEISLEKQLQINEVIPQILWKIGSQSK